MTSIDNRMETVALHRVIVTSGDFIGEIQTVGWNFEDGVSVDANGQLLAIADYPDLFALIGTTYGGDGTTTFAVPDLVGKVSVGTGTGPGLTTRDLGVGYGDDTIDLDYANLPDGSSPGAPFDNAQETLPIVYAICVSGFFPSRSASPEGAEEAVTTGSDMLGEIRAFASESAIPPNWVKADGQVLNIGTNPALFSLLGINYGGDGRTTFALPDLRGRVPIHIDSSFSPGTEGGSETVSLTTGQLPSSVGGSNQTFDNQQPFLEVSYIVALQGIYPTRDSGSPNNLEPYVGEVAMFAGNFAPRGWAFADGQLLPISQFTALFSLYGTTYGGDGRTTFALPDLRGKAVTEFGGTIRWGDRFGDNDANVTLANLNGLINDDPVVTTPTPTGDEDTAIATPVSVSDSDFADVGGTMTVTVTVANGTIDRTVPDAGVTESGLGTAVATFTATDLVALNAVLASLTVTPDTDFNDDQGTVSVTVTANDGGASGLGGGGDVVANFNVSVTPVDDPADAVDDFFLTDEATLVNGASSVLADNGAGPDTDIDSPLTVTAVNGNAANVGVQITLASGALLTLNADGTFTYDPNGAFDHLPGPLSGASNLTGTDTFTYTLNGDDTATVTVTLSGLDSDGDILIGSPGNDTLDGGIGDDTIDAQGGDDTINGVDGDDVIDGGDGIDFLTYATNLVGSVTINVGAGTVTGSENDSFSNVEAFAGTDSFGDTLIGDSGGNDLSGLGGNDRIFGNGGDDNIDGGLGFDQIQGGSGNDTINGGPGDDLIFGDSGADTLTGGGGTDTLVGGDGDDTFNVAGNDGIGDTFLGGAGTDTILNTLAGNAMVLSHLSQSDSIEIIESPGSSLLFGSFGIDMLDFSGVTFIGIDRIFTRNGDDTVVGTAGDDIINGGAGADVLDGANGNDRLFGSVGDDTLIGGAGDDQLRGLLGVDQVFGGDGNDLILVFASYDEFDVIDGGAGIDTVRNGTQFGPIILDSFDPSNNIERMETIGLGGGGPGLVTGNAGDNTLDFSALAYFNPGAINGLDGNDTITGSGVAEFILGGDGNDRLMGGQGDDELRGNAGTDTAAWSGNFADYTLFWTGGAHIVTDLRADPLINEGVDIVRQFEVYEFADGSFSVDASGNLTPISAPAVFDDLGLF